MKKLLNIVPFNEFYMNCILNNYIEMLTYKHQSYKTAAYLNSYTYYIRDFYQETIRYPRVQFSYQEIYTKNIIKQEFYTFRDYNNFVNEVKELIMSENLLSLFVDLFSWLPNSLPWQKHHWNHFAIIIGFDDIAKTFYTIEDDNSGRSIKEIPESRLVESFFGSGYFVDYGGNTTRPQISSPCLVYRFTENIKPYQLNIEDIKRNAKNIINDISNINKCNDFWKYTPSDQLEVIVDGGIADLNINYNRQIANSLLLKEIYTQNYISESKYNELSSIVNGIIRNWEIAKNKLMRAKRTNTLFSVDTILSSVSRKCLENECEFWEKLSQIL